MKNIVVLSTEPWGKMLLSKMHYAIELSQMGHKVYFVNPPQKNTNRKLVTTKPGNEVSNITILETKIVKGNLFFLFKLFAVYQKISEQYVKGIQKVVEEKIDEVWCFDPHTYVNLKKFNADKAFLFLYDFYKGSHIFKAAETADVVISVSSIILEYYRNVTTPKLLLHHGLGNDFALLALERVSRNSFSYSKNEKIKVGYMGNLLREGMDIYTGRKIIEQHPDKEFHFWGPYSLHENNVTVQNAVISKELISFIQFLQESKNVFLHGVKSQQALSQEINGMDAFLFLYSATNDMNKASNSHKILEYLSTGKVIVSTFVSNYKNSKLLEMSMEGNESALPALFIDVVNNLNLYNSKEKQKERIDFALANTYKKQIARIRQFAYNGIAQ